MLANEAGVLLWKRRRVVTGLFISYKIVIFWRITKNWEMNDVLEFFSQIAAMTRKCKTTETTGSVTDATVLVLRSTAIQSSAHAQILQVILIVLCWLEHAEKKKKQVDQSRRWDFCYCACDRLKH